MISKLLLLGSIMYSLLRNLVYTLVSEYLYYFRFLSYLYYMSVDEIKYIIIIYMELKLELENICYNQLILNMHL